MRGHLRKMRTEANAPIDYFLRLDESEHHLNTHIGSQVTLSWSGNIACVHCGNATPRSYSQGHCYPCFKLLAQCDLCVVSPERCHFAEGTCRDPSWGQTFCMRPHLVYLANSSGIKVGITNEQNLPTRWIDQGATQALPVVAVQTRAQSGFVEVAFKEHISDRTQWQQMLMADDRQVDLGEIRDQLFAEVSVKLDMLRNRFGIQAISLLDEQTSTFDYPVRQYPTRVTSMSFDKQLEISGTLIGIKGQYLIFDTGVINLRKFTGYEIEMTVGEVQNHIGRQMSLL